MTLIDTRPLVALCNRNDPNFTRCANAAKTLPAGPLVTTWPYLTEAMYLLFRAAGYPGQEALWKLRGSGRLSLFDAGPDEVDRMAELMETYRDAPMDLADASLVAVAEVLGVEQILTLDSGF